MKPSKTLLRLLVTWMLKFELRDFDPVSMTLFKHWETSLECEIDDTSDESEYEIQDVLALLHFLHLEENNLTEDTLR